MEFDINKEVVSKIDEKQFSKSKDGISEYNINKIDEEYIITKNSMNESEKWFKKNFIPSWQYNKDITHIYNIVRITDGITNIISSTSQSVWNFVKTFIILHIKDKNQDDNKKKSLLRHFNLNVDIKCTLLSIVKINSSDNSEQKSILTAIRNKFNAELYTDIYDMYLQIIKNKYPTKYKLNECYIYEYHDKDNNKCILLSVDQIKTNNDLKYILLDMYKIKINKSEFKLIATEKFYYMCELLVLYDKFTNKYCKNKKNIYVDTNNNNKAIITHKLNKTGFDTYNEDEFRDLLAATFKQKRKQKTVLTEETSDKKQANNKRNNSVSESTVETDSADEYTSEETSTDEETDSSEPKTPKTLNTKTIKQLQISKLLEQYTQEHIKQKKGEYITIQMITDAIKASKELKQHKLDKTDITRVKVKDYLFKYVKYRDNFKPSYKNTRSVIMNFMLK